MAASKTMVEIQINNTGRFGRPVALVLGPATGSLDKLTKVIQKEVTRNTDLRKKLGLTACAGCAASGFDLEFLHRFDHVVSADLGEV
jgi:hypothetical protein